MLFFLAPIITVLPSLVITAVVPWGDTVVIGGRVIRLYLTDINVGILYILAVASISVYGIAWRGGLRITNMPYWAVCVPPLR